MSCATDTKAACFNTFNRLKPLVLSNLAESPSVPAPPSQRRVSRSFHKAMFESLDNADNMTVCIYHIYVFYVFLCLSKLFCIVSNYSDSIRTCSRSHLGTLAPARYVQRQTSWTCSGLGRAEGQIDFMTSTASGWQLAVQPRHREISRELQ